MSETAVKDQDAIIQSAWEEQARWSETANSLKADLVKWQKLAAVAGILGAFLEILAASIANLGESWLWLRAPIALAGAAILAVVPYVVKTKTSRDQLSSWVRARSASEALKETIYRYLVRASVPELKSTPSDLIKSKRAISDKVSDLNVYAASIQPRKKARPLALRIDEYIDLRVNDQIDNFYRPKSRLNSLASRRFHNWVFWLSLLAVIMGALSGAEISASHPWLSALGPWVAVVTTASAAVTAHLAASRFDHQAMIYYSTADRLTNLRDEWLVMPDRLDPDIIGRFIDDCEHAISTENEAWLAKWSEDTLKGK